MRKNRLTVALVVLGALALVVSACGPTGSKVAGSYSYKTDTSIPFWAPSEAAYQAIMSGYQPCHDQSRWEKDMRRQGLVPVRDVPLPGGGSYCQYGLSDTVVAEDGAEKANPLLVRWKDILALKHGRENV